MGGSYGDVCAKRSAGRGLPPARRPRAAAALACFLLAKASGESGATRARRFRELSDALNELRTRSCMKSKLEMSLGAQARDVTGIRSAGDIAERSVVQKRWLFGLRLGRGNSVVDIHVRADVTVENQARGRRVASHAIAVAASKLADAGQPLTRCLSRRYPVTRYVEGGRGSRPVRSAPPSAKEYC